MRMLNFVTATSLALGMLLAGACDSQAANIYTYQGLNFTAISGSAPAVTTADSVTGFVEFATAPTPNETGKTDWIAFSLSDGARTLSSANGDDQFFTSDSFDFDAVGNIIDWNFSIVPDGETGNGNVLQTAPTLDFSRLGVGSIQDARSFAAGSWSAVGAVPEPTTLALLAFAAGLIGLRRRRE